VGGEHCPNCSCHRPVSLIVRALFGVPAPDPYEGRPAEFHHRCKLPVISRLRLQAGATFLCECGCPWVVQPTFTTQAAVTIHDPAWPDQYVWQTIQAQKEIVHAKPHWRFDWTAYRQLIDYPRLPDHEITRVEKLIATHPGVSRCALVYPYDPSLSRARAVLFVQPTLRYRLPELEVFCRSQLAREVSHRSAQHTDAIQFWTLPVTSEAKSTGRGSIEARTHS